MESFFAFLQSQTEAELESRRRIAEIEAAQPVTTSPGGAFYREGQLALESLPAWVLPVAIVAGVGLIVYAVAK